ncbi:MAG: dephospho-CoA kinase [Clostridia bacterium]|nr:dephospho-CoA kinase [Clostridia bacterium]
MKIIGITGPTGAGKSTLTAAFAREGALIIDADRLAREVVQVGEPCLAALAEAFGDDILLADGSLDRAALAAKAFASPEKTALLNHITHPFVIERSHRLLDASTAAIAVIDAPLLFESGMDALCDETIAVVCAREERLSRIMARDGIDEARATTRMNAQPDDTFYLARATHTMRNEGDAAAFEATAEAVARQTAAEVSR